MHKTKYIIILLLGEPLKQRLQLLNSFVRESSVNTNLNQYNNNLEDLMASGVLIVADLTDPMLSSDEANGIFQVLLHQFRNKQLNGVGKVVVFDEAHKYLSTNKGGVGKDELSTAIINTVRLMRHEGIRVLISTQSPSALPPELLELVSVTIAHHFQSRDWYQYLSSKIALPLDGFEEIKKLKVGEALVVSTKMNVMLNTHKRISNDDACVKLRMRPRITVDYGSSKLNKRPLHEVPMK